MVCVCSIVSAAAIFHHGKKGANFLILRETWAVIVVTGQNPYAIILAVAGSLAPRMMLLAVAMGLLVTLASQLACFRPGMCDGLWNQPQLHTDALWLRMRGREKVRTSLACPLVFRLNPLRRHIRTQ